MFWSIATPDNARPRADLLAVHTMDTKFKCNTPSNFYVFGAFKEAMQDRHFRSDEGRCQDCDAQLLHT